MEVLALIGALIVFAALRDIYRDIKTKVPTMKINFPESMPIVYRYIGPVLMLIIILSAVTMHLWWYAPMNTLPIIAGYVWYAILFIILAFGYYRSWVLFRRIDESNARLQRIAERYKK